MNTKHGFTYYHSDGALRWHRRYIVLTPTKLEIYGTEHLEKEIRNEKSDRISTAPLEVNRRYSALHSLLTN